MNKLLFFLGIVSLIAAGYLTWQRYSPTRLSFNAIVLPATTNASKLVPTSIEIEDLSLILPIISAEFTGKKWPLSDRGTVYLSNTPVPGETGNSILYGHNWPNILGRLTRIKPGATVDVGFSNGMRRRFIVAYTQEVTPDQTHILAPTDDRRLTLYTCTGFFDQKRFVVTAIAESS